MFDMIYRGLQVILLLMLSIILSVSFIKLSTPPPVNMVHVDVSIIIKAFAKESGQQHLSNDRQKSLSRDFAEALTRVNQVYSKENHAIMLVSGAVVAGVKDVTADIQAQVFNQIDFKVK